MSNLDIIRDIQSHYDYIDKNTLMGYINELIKKEFLRYNQDINYFNQNFENIFLNKREANNELDFAIEQAIFIVLQPLRIDIDSKNIEQVLLSWSGYILTRDINKGKYPKDIIHYFENDDFSFEDLMAMSKSQIKELVEYDNMVSFEKKEKCTKVLCKKINEVLSQNDSISDEEFNCNLGIINYRFLRIHPFDDGNGRLSRMLLNYMFNLRNGYIPIGLDNIEIDELINIYKQTSKIIYSAFMGFYLSNLEYSDETDYVETETLLTSNVTNYIIQKQQEAQRKLGIEPINNIKNR